MSARLFVLRFGVPAGDWFPLVAGCLGGVRLVALLCFAPCRQVSWTVVQQYHRSLFGLQARLFGVCSTVLPCDDKEYYIMSGQRVRGGPIGVPHSNKANVHLFLRISFFLFPLGLVPALSPLVVAYA